MKLIEKSNNQITFSTEIDESLANAIRRYIGEVSVLGVDEVEIFKNDSALYDETVAHRIGLIPLKMDKGLTNKSEIDLKLVVNKEGEVVSGDLKGKVTPVHENIPITILNKGQEMELIAKAKMGKGSDHSKFSPGSIFYRNVAEVVMDKEFSEEVRKACPNAEIKEKGDKIIVTDDKRKGVADVCEGICEAAGKTAETNYNNELIITIESFGQMETKDIFDKAIKELKKDLDETVKKVDKA